MPHGPARDAIRGGARRDPDHGLKVRDAMHRPKALFATRDVDGKKEGSRATLRIGCAQSQSGWNRGSNLSSLACCYSWL